MLTAAVLCCCSRKEDNQIQLGPEETVEAFCRAIAAGGFEEAATLCDTISMAGYIDSYKAQWEKMMKADSSATMIAAGMLSSAEMTFTGSSKDGSRRTMTYVITTETGLKKEKSATVKKEEEGWKVESITDVI